MAMKMEIQGLKDFHEDLEKAVTELPKLTKKAMEDSTRFIKNKTQNNITDEGITYTGELQRSVYTNVPDPFHGEVYVGAKHGIFVERGTRPHWPPIEPIEKWARIKLGQPGLGFVISRKIARVGTKAHKFFEPAVRESTDLVARIFEQVADQLVERMAGKK